MHADGIVDENLEKILKDYAQSKNSPSHYGQGTDTAFYSSVGIKFNFGSPPCRRSISGAHNQVAHGSSMKKEQKVQSNNMAERQFTLQYRNCYVIEEAKHESSALRSDHEEQTAGLKLTTIPEPNN